MKNKKVWVIGIIACLLIYFMFFSNERVVQRPQKDPVLEKHNATISKIYKETMELLLPIMEAELAKDKQEYMRLIELSAKKQIESDQEVALMLDYLLKKRTSQAHSRESKTVEPSIAFSEEEKLEMLAARHGLDVGKVRLIKAELEQMFEDEYLEQYKEDDYDEPYY